VCPYPVLINNNKGSIENVDVREQAGEVWQVGNVYRAAPRVAERVRQVRSAGLPVLERLK
jgi:hypothetical protein